MLHSSNAHHRILKVESKNKRFLFSVSSLKAQDFKDLVSSGLESKSSTINAPIYSKSREPLSKCVFRLFISRNIIYVSSAQRQSGACLRVRRGILAPVNDPGARVASLIRPRAPLPSILSTNNFPGHGSHSTGSPIEARHARHSQKRVISGRQVMGSKKKAISCARE